MNANSYFRHLMETLTDDRLRNDDHEHFQSQRFHPLHCINNCHQGLDITDIENIPLMHTLCICPISWLSHFPAWEKKHAVVGTEPIGGIPDRIPILRHHTWGRVCPWCCCDLPQSHLLSVNIPRKLDNRSFTRVFCSETITAVSRPIPFARMHVHSCTLR